MNALIAKGLDTLINQSKKIPEFLLMILIFTVLFSKQAKSLITILSKVIKNIVPNSLLESIKEISFTHHDFIEIWTSLLVLMLIIFGWNILKIITENPYETDLDLGGEILLYLNSVIFPCVLIYNQISTKHELSILNFIKENPYPLYLTLITFSFVIFLFLFSFTYLSFLGQIVGNIFTFNIKLRYRLLLFIVYIVIALTFLKKIGLPLV